jgi:hypothetical protein
LASAGAIAFLRQVRRKASADASRLPPRIGNIRDLEFDAVAPAPGIATERSGNMQWHAACRQEHIAKRLSGSTEGDGIDPCPVAAFKQRADV